MVMDGTQHNAARPTTHVSHVVLRCSPEISQNRRKESHAKACGRCAWLAGAMYVRYPRMGMPPVSNADIQLTTRPSPDTRVITGSSGGLGSDSAVVSACTGSDGVPTTPSVLMAATVIPVTLVLRLSPSTAGTRQANRS